MQRRGTENRAPGMHVPQASGELGKRVEFARKPESVEPVTRALVTFVDGKRIPTPLKDIQRTQPIIVEPAVDEQREALVADTEAFVNREVLQFGDFQRAAENILQLVGGGSNNGEDLIRSNQVQLNDDTLFIVARERRSGSTTANVDDGTTQLEIQQVRNGSGNEFTASGISHLKEMFISPITYSEVPMRADGKISVSEDITAQDVQEMFKQALEAYKNAQATPQVE
jgi:hypothetical protein